MATRQDPQFNIRVPAAVVKRLEASAHSNRRSLAREIEARLVYGLEGEDQISAPARNDLRTEIAIAALQGIIAGRGDETAVHDTKDAARMAVAAADDLIAELSKGEK